MNKKLLFAMQHQIKEEYLNAFAYLDMANQVMKMGYFGYAKWLFSQYREEIDHAEKTIDFLMNRHAEIDVRSLRINFSFETYTNPLEVAKAAFKNECLVTSLISKTYEIAAEVKDFQAVDLYDWFIAEQTEEEKSTRQLVKRLTNSNNWVMIDQELGKRDFNDEK